MVVTPTSLRLCNTNPCELYRDQGAQTETIFLAQVVTTVATQHLNTTLNPQNPSDNVLLGFC